MEDIKLKRLRAQIDAIDAQLLDLFAERMQTVREIAACKRGSGLPVCVPERERELLARIRTQAGEELGGYAETLFRTLLALSRAYQERLAAEEKPGKGLRCGLIGEKLGHSFSPQLHAMLGSYEYKLYERSPDALAPFLRQGDFDGLNVTIPYKKAVIPFCGALTERARRCGSVNTLVRRADGSLLGHNTDYEGFCRLLKHAGIEPRGKKALVLGSGGAAATVRAVLEDQGAREIVTVSRQGETNYVNLYERHADAQLLVNATPVGMFPNTGVSLVELEKLPLLEGVCDLVYNPAKTRLLLDAERRGIPCVNGLVMLVAQAAASSETFTGRGISKELEATVLASLERDSKNFLLIGMPGCGKSTVGAALAARLGRPFADSDGEICRRAGTDVPAIFAREGEEGFRRREQEALEALCKESGFVIACGGGAVTRPENLDLMRQNAILIWLRRDLDKLPGDGRPLTQSRGVAALYREREPLYRAAADLTVDNNGSVEDCVRQITEVLGYEDPRH